MLGKETSKHRVNQQNFLSLSSIYKSQVQIARHYPPTWQPPRKAVLSSRDQPPRPQRQRLQPHRGRSDVQYKSNHADDHTHYIGDVIPIPLDDTNARAVNATVLLGLGHAGEGGGDEIALKGLEILGGFEGWITRRGREGVDEFEDEEAGECAAQVGNAVVGF